MNLTTQGPSYIFNFLLLEMFTVRELIAIESIFIGLNISSLINSGKSQKNIFTLLYQLPNSNLSFSSDCPLYYCFIWKKATSHQTSIWCLNEYGKRIIKARLNRTNRVGVGLVKTANGVWLTLHYGKPKFLLRFYCRGWWTNDFVRRLIGILCFLCILREAVQKCGICAEGFLAFFCQIRFFDRYI